MKRIISALIITIFFITAGLLIFGMTGKVQKNKELEQMIKKLPEFSFMTLNGESFNSADIRSGPVLVVRFHPECEHCRYEISGIMKSDLPLSGAKIILVSNAEKDTVKNFLRQFDLSAYPNIKTLIDPSFKFGELFGSNIIPANFLYNKDLYLIKAFNGEVKTETILKYLKDGE